MKQISRKIADQDDFHDLQPVRLARRQGPEIQTRGMPQHQQDRQTAGARKLAENAAQGVIGDIGFPALPEQALTRQRAALLQNREHQGNEGKTEEYLNADGRRHGEIRRPSIYAHTGATLKNHRKDRPLVQSLASSAARRALDTDQVRNKKGAACRPPNEIAWMI